MPIRLFTSFAEVPSDIRASLSFPRQRDFFLSFEWFELLYQSSLRLTLSPRIYVSLDDEQQPLCAMFCATEREPSDRRLLSLGNFYTVRYGPSTCDEQPGASVATERAIERSMRAVDALIDHIANERPRWDHVRLNVLQADSPEVGRVLQRFAKAGFAVDTFFQYENWYLTTTGEDFATYFSKRPSQLKNTISRRQKKLEKAHKFRIAIARYPSPMLDDMIRDFVAVYGSSWKVPEPFPDFIPTFARQAAASGTLRLGVLYVDDKPAAAQLWVTADRKTMIYKLAYVEKLAELGAGSILSKELFRVAIDEDHVGEIDYGIGSESYKKDWMSSVRTMHSLEAYNRRTAKGIFLSVAEDAKRLAKRMRASFHRA